MVPFPPNHGKFAINNTPHVLTPQVVAQKCKVENLNIPLLQSATSNLLSVEIYQFYVSVSIFKRLFFVLFPIHIVFVLWLEPSLFNDPCSGISGDAMGQFGGVCKLGDGIPKWPHSSFMDPIKNLVGTRMGQLGEGQLGD